MRSSNKSQPATVSLDHRRPTTAYQTAPVQPQEPTHNLAKHTHRAYEVKNIGGKRRGGERHQAGPAMHGYSSQNNTVGKGKGHLAVNSREESSTNSTPVSYGRYRGISAKYSSSNLADSGCSSMEFDKCLTSTGPLDGSRQFEREPRYQSGHDPNYLANKAHSTNYLTDYNRLRRQHGDSLNDSGIIDTTTGEESVKSPRNRHHRLANGEVNNSHVNNPVVSQRTMRFEYTRPRTPPQASPAWYETPTQSPVQESSSDTPWRHDGSPHVRVDRPSAWHDRKSPSVQRRLRLDGSQPTSPCSPRSPRTHIADAKLSPTSAEVCNINQNSTLATQHLHVRQSPREEIQESASYADMTAASTSSNGVTTSANLTPSQYLENPLNRAFRLLQEGTDESPNELNMTSISRLDFDMALVGDESNHFPPISDYKTSVGVSAMGQETVRVKCRNQKCGKTEELGEARKSFKTCHNCYTYYCSRECRKAHWERHKKKCLFSKVNSICKHVMKKVHDDESLTADCTRIARAGYINKGRGCVLLVFSSHIKAEELLSQGAEASEALPVYCSIEEIQEQSSSLGEHLFELLDMCRSYNPEIKFVLEVVVIASMGGEVQSRAPRQDGSSIKKCTKLRLSTGQARQAPVKEEAETLILTAMPGIEFADAAVDRKAREVCFINIQRQLRQRGISLRHHYPEVYSKLCSYVGDGEHFTPITIFPYDKNTGKRFMCLIMPDSDPDAKWMERPDLLKELGLSTELYK